jgi:hypothetical protein
MFRALLCPSSGAFPSLHTQPVFPVWCPVRCCFQSCSGISEVFSAPDDGWKYHKKHVEQFPDINKLCNVASWWIYTYIGILLGARPILHIRRIRVKVILRLVCVLFHFSYLENARNHKPKKSDYFLSVSPYFNFVYIQAHFHCSSTLNISHISVFLWRSNSDIHSGCF